MYWIDTHAHLDDQKFDTDRESVVDRAGQAGVIHIISIGADLASSRAATDLAEMNPCVSATVGVHPHDAQSLSPGTLAQLRVLAESAQVVAIGEIGLDYYRNLSPRSSQIEAFEAQLGLAAELEKPVVIHIRDEKGMQRAYQDALGILGRWVGANPWRPARPLGVLHCYSGDLGVAKRALDMGFYLGVDGPITYPNAGALRSVVAELPLDRILIETDSPYLAPQARRGRRNEPSYLPQIGQQVADLHGVSPALVARETTHSAQALFDLLPGIGNV